MAEPETSSTPSPTQKTVVPGNHVTINHVGENEGVFVLKLKVESSAMNYAQAAAMDAVGIGIR